MLKVIKEKGQYLVSLFQVNKLNTLFSELIAEQLDDLVSVSGRHVIFNLKDVRFIDSAGFGVLLKATETSADVGSVFQICNISDEVQELIDLTGLNDSFNIVPVLEVEEKIVMVLDD